MKIIVEFPEEKYNRIKAGIYDAYDPEDALRAIKNGIPHTVGHWINHNLYKIRDKALQQAWRLYKDLNNKGG